MRLQQSLIASVVGLLGLFLCAAAGAGEAPKPTDWGDFFSRPTLFGDWGGARTQMEEKGITFASSVTQTGMGVVDGGTNSAWESGGRGELKGRFDTGKAGLWPGGFLTAELEGNWNKSVDLDGGAPAGGHQPGLAANVRQQRGLAGTVVYTVREPLFRCERRQARDAVS